jgi:hypothetical protein
MAIDNDKLQEMLGKFVGDLGATVAAASVVIGHNLGLYKAGKRRRPSSNSPAAPTPTRATWPSGCAARRPAATSAMTRRPIPTR